MKDYIGTKMKTPSDFNLEEFIYLLDKNDFNTSILNKMDKKIKIHSIYIKPDY